ncbi:hypothetical protein KM043_006819 [Ampulex compressa]|nr:hypothetical protein KM043_006819 [Ampulex compressa]
MDKRKNSRQPRNLSRATALGFDDGDEIDIRNFKMDSPIRVVHLPTYDIRGQTVRMKKYLTDMEWKLTIDHMQVHLKCCGVDTFEDWHRTYWLQRDALILDSPTILEYAEVYGRVTPPVVPWSCCRIDVKGPCYHDPLQLPNPERDSTYESLNTGGCLVAMRIVVDCTLYSSVVLIVLLLVLQIGVIPLSRLDFTAARNAVALGNRWGASPGWLYGRLDFGNATGPNLCQIDRRYSGRGDPMVDLRPLICESETE